MPLFEVTAAGLKARPIADFAVLGMYERADLQRLLRDDISALGDDLLVVAEEFGNWEDARRRIDLLALDRAGRLVVIELKRTDDGGHMELQAIRYAAMVSSMGFAEVASAYAAHCAKHRMGEDVDARAELIGFLDLPEGDDDPVISTEVRIMLVSADFGREITTTVLWLNGFDGMDIRCIRLIPYDVDGKVLLDIQQVLPLPAAADYQVRLRRKDAARERARTSGRDLTRFHIVVDGEALPEQNKRNAIRTMIEQLFAKGVPLADIREHLNERAMKVLDRICVDGDDVREAMVAADPKTDANRYFCDQALVDGDAGQTYVVTKMWGLHTEPALQALADAFPTAGVTFRRADAPE
ncbi:MAG TPA: hypothetical protein VJ653_07680 [Acidimicrobiales bacterium]|nr:hypothetical protein [Acidimicrobiales bacterium]